MSFSHHVSGPISTCYNNFMNTSSNDFFSNVRTGSYYYSITDLTSSFLPGSAFLLGGLFILTAALTLPNKKSNGDSNLLKKFAVLTGGAVLATLGVVQIAQYFNLTFCIGSNIAEASHQAWKKDCTIGEAQLTNPFTNERKVWFHDHQKFSKTWGQPTGEFFSFNCP